MLKNKKGQGAMEYLMTYGWAILVVMIVGVVLWQLGIFGGGPGAANTARGFGRIKVMEPSIKYDAGTTTDAMSFTVMNGAGQTVSGLSIIEFGGDCSAVGTDTLETSLDAGATDSVSLNCGNKAGGDSFSVDLTFNYTMTVAGSPVDHQEKGTIRGAAEPV